MREGGREGGRGRPREGGGKKDIGLCTCIYTCDVSIIRKNTYGERFEAFFNPQATGYHSFFVAADDQAEVFFGLGNNISNVTT